jgi:hypothetical protein
VKASYFREESEERREREEGEREGESEGANEGVIGREANDTDI